MNVSLPYSLSLRWLVITMRNTQNPYHGINGSTKLAFGCFYDLSFHHFLLFSCCSSYRGFLIIPKRRHTGSHLRASHLMLAPSGPLYPKGSELLNPSLHSGPCSNAILKRGLSWPLCLRLDYSSLFPLSCIFEFHNWYLVCLPIH